MTLAIVIGTIALCLVAAFAGGVALGRALAYHDHYDDCADWDEMKTED